MVDRNKKMQIAGWFNVDEANIIREFAKQNNRSLSFIITFATMKFIKENTEEEDESIPEYTTVYQGIPEDTNNG